MCDSDRVEEKGGAAATGDGEWLGGAGRGAGVAMPPRTCTSPAPCTRPLATYLLSTGARQREGCRQLSRYLDIYTPRPGRGCCCGGAVGDLRRSSSLLLFPGLLWSLEPGHRQLAGTTCEGEA